MTDEPLDPIGRSLFTTKLPDGDFAVEAAPGQHVCDFCLDPSPVWAYPCGPVAILGNATLDASDDEWAACEVCHELIETGDTGAMIRRMVIEQESRIRAAHVPGVLLPPLRARVRVARTNLHAFLDARQGEPRRYR